MKMVLIYDTSDMPADIRLAVVIYLQCITCLDRELPLDRKEHRFKEGLHASSGPSCFLKTCNDGH